MKKLDKPARLRFCRQSRLSICQTQLKKSTDSWTQDNWAPGPNCLPWKSGLLGPPDSWALGKCTKSTDICSPNVGSIYPIYTLRAHRKPPTDIHPPNVGRIYLIQIYMLQNVHSQALRPKGAQKTSNWHVSPKMLAHICQLEGFYGPFELVNVHFAIYICIGYQLPTFGEF